MSSSRDSSISVAQRCNLQEGTRKSFSHSDLGHFFPQVWGGGEWSILPHLHQPSCFFKSSLTL